MQGLHEYVPMDVKCVYLNELLRAGFDTLDFGSFVSPKAIPQMRDTAALVDQLDISNSQTKLLAIVPNKRGAADACAFNQITYLGYPFSISETFQLRNTNATVEESLHRIEEIQNLCVQHNKILVAYLSMGFGNPYGDEWNVDIVKKWVEALSQMGIHIMSLSDTIGVSNPENIAYLFHYLIPEYPNVEFGAHLHTRPAEWKEKVEAAYAYGCRRFDGAIKGYGGCPMATDDLTGNMPTENLIQYFNEIGHTTGIDENAFASAFKTAGDLFTRYI